jgi:catechol 2,3-dioxygenase-like lactoylglutathione lyase family enzyme
MITKLSHVPIFVLDQASAKEFYVDKLGFKVKMEADMGGGDTWLTISPPEQPDLEIILAVVKPGMMFDEPTANALKELVKSGKLGAAVFHTDDCFKTYEELKAKGVKFRAAPEDKFYGIEAIIEDDSGNWFSMTQPKHL